MASSRTSPSATRNDESFTITNWNTGAEKIYGWKKEEVLGRSSMFLQNEYPGQDPREVLEKILETGRYDGEVIQSRKDGTRVSIETRLIARKDNKGETTDWICINRDITERKQAEEALQIKDWAIESATNAIVTSDMEGNLNYVNPAFLKLWGYGSPAEALGKPATGFWQMGEKAAEVMEAVRTKGGWIGELVAQGKDGALFDVQAAASMVVNAAGQPVCMQASFADITDRKQAEEKLQESEQRYRLLIETANEGILVAQGASLKFVNPIALELTGYTEEELLSLPFLELIHHDDRELARNNYLKRLKGEAVEPRYQFRVLKKDKSIRWVEMSGVKIEWEGQPATMNLVTDITDRKQAEDTLRESEEKYRLLIETMQDGVYRSSHEGKFLEVNPAMVKMLGYESKEELLA
ncbi:MAG: PAS domain S-box protein, partial [Coprothermobacterota bacterium]|nr:PAS domain S-box protein [Coprothermobacterota bacterium]